MRNLVALYRLTMPAIVDIVGSVRRNSQTCGRVGRARAGRHSSTWDLDRRAVAAGDAHRAGRVPDHGRSSRRRVRRQPGAAGRQRHRFHAFRIQHRLGSISKQGDRYLRSLFMAGALAVIRYAKIHGSRHRPWLTALLARRPSKVAAIALANKIARVVWAMMARASATRNRSRLRRKRDRAGHPA